MSWTTLDSRHAARLEADGMVDGMTPDITAAARSDTQGAATPTALTLRGLHKRFGQIKAVDGVDLEVSRGETVALLGPNGAGKSTTVDLLLGLTSPDSGDALVYGLSPRDAIRQGLIGAMLQSGGMPGDLVVGDLVHGVATLHTHPISPKDALRRAKAEDLSSRKVRQLSGGQMQRVRLALALLPDADLLVLDEPTSAMDVGSRRTFWSDMSDLTSSGRTLMFTTHHLEEADAYADRIVLMRAGRIVADGTASEIKGMVGLRRVSAKLPYPDEARLSALPGVSTVRVVGDTVALGCTDSDTALRALLAAVPGAHDIEVGGAALEDAFLALTADDVTETQS
jgi:ABC-2 type transport system ATP-binding protein